MSFLDDERDSILGLTNPQQLAQATRPTVTTGGGVPTSDSTKVTVSSAQTRPTVTSESNPLQKIGYMLLSVASGAGDKNATALLGQYQEKLKIEATSKAAAMENQTKVFKETSEAITRALEAVRKVPLEQQPRVAAAFDKQLFGGNSVISGMLETYSADEAAGVAASAGALAPFLVAVSGGDAGRMRDALKDKNMMDVFRQANVSVNLDGGLSRISSLVNAAGSNPEFAQALKDIGGELTFAHVRAINKAMPEKSPFKLSPGQIQALADSPETLASLGITPDKAFADRTAELAKARGMLPIKAQEELNAANAKEGAKFDTYFDPKTQKVVLASAAEARARGLEPMLDTRSQSTQVGTPDGPVMRQETFATKVPAAQAVGGAIRPPSDLPLPTKPPSESVMQSITGGFSSLQQLDNLKKTVSQSGLITGGLNQLGAYLGTNEGAAIFDTNRNNLAMFLQSLIKGVPSNFDVRMLLKTIPGFYISENLNKVRLDMLETVIRQATEDTIAWHVGSGTRIPQKLREDAEFWKLRIPELGLEGQGRRPGTFDDNPMQKTAEYMDKFLNTLDAKELKTLLTNIAQEPVSGQADRFAQKELAEKVEARYKIVVRTKK